MARRKKNKKDELSEEETEHIVDHWLSSIEELRDFFYEHSPEEEGDVFYDKFLVPFLKVEQTYQIMLQYRMIVRDDQQVKEVSEKEVEELEIEPQKEGKVRRDN